MRLGPHTIYVLQPGTKPVDYGTGTELDWSDPDRTMVEGCSVQPIPAPEYTIDRNAIVTRWQVFAPAATDVSATDRIEWDGDTYDIDGDVARWDFGALSHLALILRRSTD